MVNGGIVIARKGVIPEHSIRWVEGYRKPVADFAGASASLGATHPGEAVPAGMMEVYETPREEYTALPHRPLFRPSQPALELLQRFKAVAEWNVFGKPGAKHWELLSNTRALEEHIATLRRTGFYERLRPGDAVLLGIVTEGGQGLATADDRRFLAAVEGTDAAAAHLAMQQRLELIAREGTFAAEYNSHLKVSGDREQALLALWTAHGAAPRHPLAWPRIGLFRVVPSSFVRTRALSDDERKHGIRDSDSWVPFEKGDQSQELEGDDGKVSRIGAAWTRENPLVIDWSRQAVSLLRRRAAGGGAQTPYFRNEDLWFHEGITWNAVGSYLRLRAVPAGSIFGHGAPLIRPVDGVTWLTPRALLALLNADTVDFLLRTFLGSRMNIHVGDLRHVPVPVLDDGERAELESLADRAIAARSVPGASHDGAALKDIEREVNRRVRALYGIDEKADLWVVR